MTYKKKMTHKKRTWGPPTLRIDVLSEAMLVCKMSYSL
jgi:hypothetical protein